MKTLTTLALSALLVSTNAFAFTTQTLGKVLAEPQVKQTLDSKLIRVMKDGPSYRCMGCSAIDLTVFTPDAGESQYRIQIMDFAGRFSAKIYKLEQTGNAPNSEN